MPNVSLDLRNLEYAIKVAECGSFRCAARVLAVEQSTVSRRVQILENKLGFNLFNRGRNGVTVTQYGLDFLDAAKRNAVEIEVAVKAAVRAERLASNQVSVGFTASIANPNFVRLLERFRQIRPNLQIDLHECAVSACLSGLAQRTIDAALIPSFRHGAHVQSLPVWKEQLCLVVSRDHSLARMKKVTWKDIGGQTVILSNQCCGEAVRAHLLNNLRDDFDEVKLVSQNIGRGSVLSLVELGYGSTILCRSSDADFYKGAGTVDLEIAGGDVQIDLVWNSFNKNRGLQNLVNLAKDALSRS